MTDGENLRNGKTGKPTNGLYSLSGCRPALPASGEIKKRKKTVFGLQLYNNKV